VITFMLFLQVAISAQQLGQQPAPAAATAAQSEATDPKKLGVLEGRVVNSKTGEAVRKANITLRPIGGPGMAGAIGVGPMAPAAPYAASTDAEGKFRIDKVEPGNYNMMAERQGFVRQQYGARQNSMMGTTIKIGPGQEMRELNFKLLPQAVITGRVFDEEGEPLARVQIQVLRRRYFRGKQQPMPMGGGMTLDTGEFRVADLAPGRYWISATYRGQMMFGDAPARNTADKPEESYVTTYYPNSLDAAGARYIDVQAGQELPGIDLRMRKARVYRIRGKVTGSSVRNVRLMVMPRDGAPFFGFPGMGAMVKEDGSFEIGAVQSGSYYVSAMPMQGMMNALGKVAVDVGQENVENVTLALGSGASLKGSIRVDGDLQQLEQRLGKKITFDSVRIQPMPAGMIPFGASMGTAKDDGSFVIENVAPDKYRLMVMGFPQGTYLKSIRVGDQEALDSGFELSTGVSAAVQITLGVGVGQVTGTVQDAKQQPASGAMVTLLPDPIKEERNDLQRITTTDQNGQFTLQGIPPGEYKLYAWEDVEPGSYMDPEFLKPHEGKAHKISVKADSQQQVPLIQISKDLTATP
jgi:hypothetical protein